MPQLTKLLLLAVIFMVIGGNQLMAKFIGPSISQTSNYTSTNVTVISTTSRKPNTTTVRLTTTPKPNTTTVRSTTSSKPKSTEAPNVHNHPKFYFAPLQMNWFGASVYCQERNWTLVILDTENSRLEFESYLTRYGLRNHRIWTAGNQLVDMKTWRWGINGPIMTYSHWGRGEPSRSKNRQHCLKLFDKSLSWDDDYCDNVLYFACLKH